MLNFVIKVVSRCNLNCSYCYVYNKGDESWRSRPPLISENIFRVTIYRIRRYCERAGQKKVLLTFHGGEPCLAGLQRFVTWCEVAREELAPHIDIRFALQTNGTLIDTEWAKALAENRVRVGISLDGAKEVHDSSRIDHSGRGSYDDAVRGLDTMLRAGVSVGGLAVVKFGSDGLAIHRHLVGLGLRRISYLMPDFTHDTIAPIWELYGRTPCADVLLPVLEDWWANGTLAVQIGLFWHASRLILGGQSTIDLFGNRPMQFVFIETNGEIEGLDVLRVCGNGAMRTGLNVLHDDFWSLREVSDLHRAAIFEGVSLPKNCYGCAEQLTCSGGYLPHRYSLKNGFDNATVWCADTLKIFARLRELLDVSPEETTVRRGALAEMAQ